MHECIVWACEYGTWDVGVDALCGGTLVKMNAQKLVKRKTKEKKTYVRPKQCLKVLFGPINMGYGG